MCFARSVRVVLPSVILFGCSGNSSPASSGGSSGIEGGSKSTGAGDAGGTNSTGGTSSTGGSKASSGGAAAGGAATGGASIGGANAGDCTAPVLRVTEVDLGATVATNETEATTTGTNLMVLALSPIPSGGSRLMWHGSDSAIHVTALNADDTVSPAVAVDLSTATPRRFVRQVVAGPLAQLR
jgi:hypothetical protein